MNKMIRQVNENDARNIADIYNYYIRNSIATFEEEAISEEEVKKRIRKIESSNFPWLVSESDGSITGYAYASKWQERSAYRFSAEITIYMHHEATGKGIGTKLYTALFQKLESLNINSVIGGVSLPNPASVALHEKFGMEKVAHFKKVGYKFGKWIDVGYWQIRLDTQQSSSR